MPLSAIDPESIAAIVLAAGASRRMGTNKMLLELDGEPLVRRAVRRAHSAGLDPIIVVVGRDAERVETALHGITCEFVVNPDFTGPTSGSLHCGLRQLNRDVNAAIVMLGDMIHVTGEMLHTMVEDAHTIRVPIIASRYGDVLAPPILFRREMFEELLAWTGEGCGKPIVQKFIKQALVKEWPSSALVDVDTPDDWELARNG